ncbi:MAG TPA: universal stress protein [Solirubrobacteraceae bacterium]|jgi:nucleotide-binding universal stress UspA family protein|nr:universal stress protein [Solirubrobacteraceae bacterium]
MAPHAIVSYDDTQNDHDALMLGRILRDAGAELTLAYVRHAQHRRLEREQFSQQEAEQLLERGARWLDDPHIRRRVVVSPSTGQGLGWLTGQEGADLLVFGSDYRTPRGHVAIGRSAQTLLEGGPAALSLAPAAFATGAEDEIRTIGILRGSADEAAIETAFSLARRMDATVVDNERGVDLLIVGSRREAREGRVMITSNARNAIEQATAPVLVVARGVPLHFDTLVTA